MALSICVSPSIHNINLKYYLKINTEANDIITIKLTIKENVLAVQLKKNVQLVNSTRLTE